MLDWTFENIVWALSGIAAIILCVLATLMIHRSKRSRMAQLSPTVDNSNEIHNKTESRNQNEAETCPDCNGLGGTPGYNIVADQTCPRCNGEGVI